MARPPANVRFINPSKIAPPRGYSHVAEVSSGRLIFISGQIALDEAGNLVGKDDFRAQTQQVFENLKTALEAVGANFHHVVKLTNYLADLSQLSVFREIRDQYVNTANPPASTTFQVKSLVREEFLVEIDAVAILP